MILWFVTIQAFADKATPAQKGSPFMDQLLLFGVIFFIFYFLVLRPQAKKTRAHHKFLSELKRGTEVLTSSGILGVVKGHHPSVCHFRGG